VAARQPTIIATSIGFLPEGPDPTNLRPGPSYRLAAELARAGPQPRICIIGTATGDDSSRLAAFHNAFSKLGFISSHLSLFPMPNVHDIRAHLLAQDVIWVGGGSTANLLALWRLHGLDVVLRECWESGVVLKGVSAGSLCWHVGGTTDSFGPTLVPVTNALGFLPYSNSPHHDAEEQRRPLIHRLIADGTLPDGYATENGTGLVYFGTELVDAFTELPGQLAYSLTREGAVTRETALETRLL
jgi:peptidase E